MASTVKETSIRSRVRVRPQSTETQSSSRAPLNAGSSAVASLWKALDQPVAGSPGRRVAVEHRGGQGVRAARVTGVRHRIVRRFRARGGLELRCRGQDLLARGRSAHGEGAGPQALRAGPHREPSRPRTGADDRQGLSVEGRTGARLIALSTLLAPIVEPGERTTVDVERQEMFGTRHHHTARVHHLRGHEAQRTPVRGKGLTVRGEAHGVRLPGGAQHIGGHGLAVPPPPSARPERTAPSR